MALEMNCTEIDPRVVKEIACKYNPLHFSSGLSQLLSLAFPCIDFEEWEKINLHRLISDVVINNYGGEEVLKYNLVKHFSTKHVVAAFEIKVSNSRADFLTINGCTSSFEIKSGLDNLYKLKKQVSDYVRAFEYNYLVVHDRHLANAIEIAPDSFGIWSFEKSGGRKIHREPLKNQRIDAEFQISLLTKKELSQQFRSLKGNPVAIMNECSSEEINERFKDALKIRYRTRWDFLLEHMETILPVDLQFFFNRNIHPKLIYK
jgi:D-mannonate dehydratase